MGERDFLSDDEDSEDFFTREMDQAADALPKGMDWSRREARPWDAVRDLIPDEIKDAKLSEDTKKHFRSAQHEILLGVRSLLEDWIDKTDPERPKQHDDLLRSNTSWRAAEPWR